MACSFFRSRKSGLKFLDLGGGGLVGGRELRFQGSSLCGSFGLAGLSSLDLSLKTGVSGLESLG